MYDDVVSKWNLRDSVPIDEVCKKLKQLEEKIKILEEENVETTNTLYEIMNSIEAVDRRIDIIAESSWKEQFDV